MDLFGLSRDAAREELLAGLSRKRRKPATEPPFPPEHAEPAFPGVPASGNAG